MAITILGDVTRNRLDVSKTFLASASGFIDFRGSGSTVAVGDGSSGYAVAITVEHDCSVEIGVDCALGALEIFSVRGSHIVVGERCAFTSKASIHAHEKNTISIGSECLIASSVWMTASDMHPIFDRATGERINPGADITLGDRVWVANDVTILKGVTIGAGSIVGTGSVVTRSAGPECLIAGNPARVIREGVFWGHAL